MSKVIDSLTAEQEAKVKEYFEKHLKIGLATSATEPANRKAAEEGVRLAYDSIGLDMPEIHWVECPIEAARYLKERGVITTLQEALSNACYGPNDLHWMTFYKFILDELDVEYDGQSLDGPYMISCNAGWWWPYDEVCVLSERCSVFNQDENFNLHSETGPSVAWGDGFKTYHWHGVSIPGEWIEDKENVDSSLALTWENIEQRRCLAEIIGWEKVLKNLDVKVLDKDPDPQIGELLIADLPDSPGEKFLKVLCGTGRTFVLPVHPDSETALEANARSYGLDPEELKIEVRT